MQSLLMAVQLGSDWGFWVVLRVLAVAALLASVLCQLAIDLHAVMLVLGAAFLFSVCLHQQSIQIIVLYCRVQTLRTYDLLVHHSACLNTRIKVVSLYFHVVLVSPALNVASHAGRHLASLEQLL